MKKFVALSALCLVVSAVWAADKPTDFAAAKALSKSKNQPLLIDFFADWCGPCKQFDRAAKRDRDVKAELGKVVLFKIDAEKGEGIELAKRYKVSGYPTFVLTNAEGNVIDRWSGYGKDYFIDSLQVGMSDLSTIETKIADYPTKKKSLTASSLARYFEAREEFDKALDYYRDAQKLNTDPERDYLYPIFDITFSQLSHGQGTFANVRKAADNLIASDRLDDGTKLTAIRRMTKLTRQLNEHGPYKSYLEAGMNLSRGKDGFVADMYREFEIDHTLYITKDKPKAVTLKKALLPDGWEASTEQLNNFAWWCFENSVNLEEAGGLAQKAVDMMKPGSERAMVIDTLAEIASARGDHQQAVKLMKQAIEEHPGHDYYQKQLVRFQKRMNNHAG